MNAEAVTRLTLTDVQQSGENSLGAVSKFCGVPFLTNS